jgi:hypothetical protein
MPTSIEINSLPYVCMHEAGHVVAIYLEGGIVEFVELLEPQNGRFGGRTRPQRLDGAESLKTVASAGFAVEYLLFRAGRVVSNDGNPITEKAFHYAAMNNATIDRISFFGYDAMQPDGTWPENLDKEYLEYAISEVAPLLKPMLGRIEEIATALQAEGRLEQTRIEGLVFLKGTLFVT